MKKHPKRNNDMQRAGDIKLVKKLAAKVKPLTTAEEKFLEAVSKIRQEDPDAVEKAYMARQLVQCTLPHSNPGDVPAWSRKNGNLTLGIQPGVDIETGKSFGYPYGVLPRLLLFWIVTEAVQIRQRCLDAGENPRLLKLDNSLSAFMRQLGLIPASASGGKNSDAKRLREQMERLFRCRISFQITSDEAHRHGQRWLDMQVAPEGELWWNPKHPDQGALWGSWIELGEKFYDAIIAAPVPVNMKALRALKRSPLALDLYALVAFKVYIANLKKTPQFIDWPGLRLQLGADYDAKRIDHFKEKAKKALGKVRSAFPAGVWIEWNRAGLSILPGAKPAVAPRASAST